MTNASDNDIRRRLRAMGLIVPADLGDIKTVSAASATDISALASCPNLGWVCADSATDISALASCPNLKTVCADSATDISALASCPNLEWEIGRASCRERVLRLV